MLNAKCVDATLLRIYHLTFTIHHLPFTIHHLHTTVQQFLLEPHLFCGFSLHQKINSVQLCIEFYGLF